MTDKIYCVENLTFLTKQEIEERYDEVDWKNLRVGYSDETGWREEPIEVFEIGENLGMAFGRKWFIALNSTGQIGILFIKYPPEFPGCNWHFYTDIKELVRDIIANQNSF